MKGFKAVICMTIIGLSLTSLAVQAKDKKENKQKQVIETVIYTVQKGDSLRHIALIFGVTPSDIIKHNKGVRALRVGQDLIIPLNK